MKNAIILSSIQKANGSEVQRLHIALVKVTDLPLLAPEFKVRAVMG